MLFRMRAGSKKLILCHLEPGLSGRHVFLKMDPEQLEAGETQEYAGSSHEKITEELVCAQVKNMHKK